MSLPKLIDLALYLPLCVDDLILDVVNLILQDFYRTALVKRLVVAHPPDEFAKHQVLWVDVVWTLNFCCLLFAST